MNIEKLIESVDDYSKKHKIKYFFGRVYYITTEVIKNIFSLYYLRQIKYFFQRGIRGYDDSSYWKADTYLGEIILGVLKQFRDTERHAISFPVFNKDGDVDEEKSNQNEKKILREMIEGFDFLVNSDDKMYEIYRKYKNDKARAYKKYEEEYEKAKKKATLFIKYFNHLWD